MRTTTISAPIATVAICRTALTWQTPPVAAEQEPSFRIAQTLGMDRRGDRRDDRGGRRDTRQDCRDAEGAIGGDKRDCKQDKRRGNNSSSG